MIRDGWLESPAIDQLDPHAERFFLRLCLRADDFGRYHALPQLLKSNLYPLKDEVKSTEVAKWLSACAAAGLLRCYNADGKPFLEILKFGQRMRQAVSKFPAPSDNCPTDARHMPVICPSSDGQLPDIGRPESEGEGEEKVKENRNISPDPSAVASEIYALYPKKVGREDALKAIGKQLKAGKSADHLKERTRIYNEAVACWPHDDRKFIPHASTWFNRGSFDDDASEWRRVKPGTTDDSEYQRAAKIMNYTL